MSDVQKPAMPLEDIDRLKDQAKRAVGAAEFLAYAEDRARRARAIRDNAIRRLRDGGKTVPEIAAITGLSVNTIKVVIR